MIPQKVHFWAMIHRKKYLQKSKCFFFLFVVCKKGRGGSKKERYRATVRWTVVTATDQAAQFAARVDPPHLHQKKASVEIQVPLFFAFAHSTSFFAFGTIELPKAGGGRLWDVRSLCGHQNDNGAGNAQSAAEL